MLPTGSSSSNPSTPPAIGGAGAPAGAPIAPSNPAGVPITSAIEAIAVSSTTGGATLDASRLTDPVPPILDRVPLTEADLDKLYNAAFWGNIDEIRALIRTQTIPQEHLGMAVRHAVKEGHEDIVRFLLSDGRNISEKDLGEALIYAATEGHKNIVRFLLSDGRNISQEDFGLAVRRAALEGRESVVRVLLQDGRVISNRDLGSAVGNAARNGHEAVVRTLLDGRTISPVDLRDSIRFAASRGFETVVRTLLDGRDVSEECLRQAVLAASNGGYEAAAPFREDEAGFIPFGQHEAILRFLLPSITEFENYDRNTLILSASSLGWNDILENLLQRGPIGTSLRQSALTLARNDSIRDMLGMASVLSAGSHAAASSDRLPASALRLSLVDLKENPLRWLSHVTERGLPTHVSFSEYPSAVDVGGITKQFITTLVEALILKEAFKRTEDGLPLIVKDQDRICVWQLGRLYSMLHERNGSRSDKILAGTLFHPRFLELVKNAGSSESEAIKIADAAHTLQGINALYRCLTAVILEPNAANKAAYREASGCEEGEEEQGAKEQLIEYLHSARAFYDGCTERFKEYMAGSEASIALASIQGKDVTADKLIAALTLEGSGAHLRQKFEWIQEKVRGADKPFLIKFLKAITGKTTLSPGTEIKIKETWRDGQVFEMHTCFNSIDVPKGAMEKEAFLAALEASVSGEGYNIA